MRVVLCCGIDSAGECIAVDDDGVAGLQVVQNALDGFPAVSGEQEMHGFVAMLGFTLEVGIDHLTGRSGSILQLSEVDSLGSQTRNTRKLYVFEVLI